MKKLNILSLFDGISCARVALERAGFKIEKYYASDHPDNCTCECHFRWNAKRCTQCPVNLEQLKQRLMKNPDFRKEYNRFDMRIFLWKLWMKITLPKKYNYTPEELSKKNEAEYW